MTLFSLRSLPAVVALGALLSSACGAKSPTSPSTTPNAPVVSSIAPAAPTASSGLQNLTVKGSGFSAVSVMLRAPDGGTTTYPPSTISELTTTSFTATVTLAVQGTWTLIVRNGDGSESAATSVPVAAPTATNPQILTVGPAVIVSSSLAQTIAVAGVNFRAGLSLVVRGSNGVATTYNGASLTSVTASSFSALVMLPAPDAYQLTVRNSDGLESGVFTLIVNATPIVTGVTPAVIATSSASQSFTVSGLHFLPGLSYVLKGPDTGGVTHGPVDVSDLTSVHFTGVGVFNVPGDWTITVINANGVSSGQFAFRVG